MLLDNAQRRDEALDMYKRCIGNQYGRISKQADQLIWGMTTAAKKMKADQFDYDGIKDKYDPFLIALTKEKQWKQIEVSEEEEEELNKMTTGSIALVAAVPIAALLLIAMH
jgi:catalase (peroxidase I)